MNRAGTNKSSQGGRRGTAALVLRAAAVAAIVVLIVNLAVAMTTQRDMATEAASLQLRSHELRGVLHRGLSGSGAMGLQAASLRASREVKAFKERLVDGKGLTKVLEEVFEAARNSGLTIMSADYQPVTIKDTEISRYFFSFPVEGSYRQVRKFIYDIENSQHMIVVESVTMNSSKRAQRVIGVDIEISAYFI